MSTIGEIASTASPGLGIALPLMGVNPVVGAAVAAGVGLIALVDKIGQGRKAANKMTGEGGPQNILNKQLAAISASQSTAEEKSQATDKAWRDFLGAANDFAAANPKQSKVVKQAIYETPALTQTVQTLLGKNPLDSEYTNLAAKGMATGNTKPNPGPSVAGTILKSAATGVGSYMMGTQLQGTKPLSSMGTPEWNPTSGQWENVAGPAAGKTTSTAGRILNAVTGGAPGQQQEGQGWLQRLLPQIIGAGTSIFGGIVASNAAKDAATTQSDAALEAARMQQQTGREALDFNKDVFRQQQQNLQPWLEAGTGALRSIQDITSKPFELPSYDEAMKDPGIQYALSEGQRVLDASLRSKNLSLSGKAVKETQSRAMNIASTGYQDVVNRQLQARQANLNPLFSLAGLGQDSTNALNSGLNTMGGRNADISMTTASNVGNQTTSAAAARAAGQAASGNIWGSVAGNVGNNFLEDYQMQQLLKRIPLNQMGG